MTTVYKRGIIITGGGENASASSKQSKWDEFMTISPDRLNGYRPGDLEVALQIRFDWWRFYKQTAGGAAPTNQTQTNTPPSDPDDYTDSVYRFSDVLDAFFNLDAVQNDGAKLWISIRDIGTNPRYPRWLSLTPYNGTFLSVGGTSRYMPRYDRYSGPDIDDNEDVGDSPPIADEFISFHRAMFDYIDAQGWTQHVMGVAFYELYGNGGGTSPPVGYSATAFNHGAMLRVKTLSAIWGPEGVPVYQGSMNGFSSPTEELFFRYARESTKLGGYRFGSHHPDLKFDSTTNNLASRFTDPNVGDYLFGVLPLSQATEANGERSNLYFAPGVSTPWGYSNQNIAKTATMDLWAMSGAPQAAPPDDDSGLGQSGTDPAGLMQVDVIHINPDSLFTMADWIVAFDALGPTGTFAAPPGVVGDGGGEEEEGSTGPANWDSTPIITAPLVFGATGATTAGVDTTGANFLVVTCHGDNGDTFTVSDSKSNTWVPGTPRDNGTTTRTQVFYCLATSVGSGHTFTVSSAAESYIGAQAWHHDGDAVALDAENGNIQTSTVQSLTTGSITPSVDGALIIDALTISANFGGTPTLSVGTLLDFDDGGSSFGAAQGWYKQTTASAVNPLFSWTTGHSCTAAIAAFIATSTGNVPDITSNGGASTAAISINENETYVTVVTADGDTPMAFSITGGADAADFSIGASSGVLSFAVAPDYESPHDSNTDNDYVVEVTATNGSGTDVQTITVTVLDVDETTPPEPDGEYEAIIGPFGNNTGAGKLVSQTVYVVYGRVDESGDYAIPSHIPSNMPESVSIGNAVAVDLDTDGYGTLILDFDGIYHGFVYKPDNTYVGALGYDGVIGVTAEDA